MFHLITYLITRGEKIAIAPVSLKGINWMGIIRSGVPAGALVSYIAGQTQSFQ
jgi:hypothetical protein